MSLNVSRNNIISIACRSFGFYFLLVLTACTTTIKPDTVDDPEREWSQRQIQLKQILSWKINGRLAVTNKAEVWHLSVIWEQQAQQYKIHLSGPFGAGAVQLSGDQFGVSIQTADQTHYAQDASQLLYDNTGVQIPIESLFYWIRGLANPKFTISNQKLDAYGRLKKLSQNNWNIRFKRYEEINAIYLPSKVFIKQNNLDIRFVIEDWLISS
ncbi:hypothetical protein MNBD_GAMMA22-837 [hydrothermal vent metagenome]|uniref:Outer-membrane lipoprotein LolB n=1 Tax=hydrothermal vent metagenome TaxID=652676 RepID=A0A3B1A3A6_9ZZZZ